MKIKLSLDDSLRNSGAIQEFLSRKEMGHIYGGQNVTDDEVDTHSGGTYTNGIYPNYAESTYVNRFPYTNIISGNNG